MKYAKSIITVIILSMQLLTACKDDDNKTNGNPVITLNKDINTANMGDSIVYDVDCGDEANIPLSTLKAYLYYGEELVSQSTMRTNKYGKYTNKIYFPYERYIPNGKVQLKLVLQNIKFKTVEKNIDIELKRPEYEHIDFVMSDGTKHTMTPDNNNPYIFSTIVNSTSNTFKGHFIAPAYGNAGKQLAFGADGEDIKQNSDEDIKFVNNTSGNITVTFNTRNYDYGPNVKLSIIPIEFNQSRGEVFTGNLIQRQLYTFTGDNTVNASDWFYDTDFFTRNNDGTYTFTASSGTYSIKADFANKYFRIWAMNGTNPTTLQADGSGAIWIIGNAGINKPTWTAINHDWWTGTANDVCMAPIAPKKYQITLTIGKQLRGTNINFKFFGQPTWGIEFKGTAGAYHISTDNNYFLIGNGTNGHDNGNIVAKTGAVFNDGDTFLLTIDCTGGVNNAILKVVKK